MSAHTPQATKHGLVCCQPNIGDLGFVNAQNKVCATTNDPHPQINHSIRFIVQAKEEKHNATLSN
eukprot:2410700-Amphidinium_carterae.1